MFLYQRKNGYWYIGLDRNKKRIFISCKTKSKSKANEIFREYNPAIKTGKTLEDLKAKAMQYAQGNLSVKTQSMYRLTFERFIKFLTDAKLTDVTKTDIENFKGMRLKDSRQFSKYTLNLEIAVLKKSFSIAKEHKWITENPAEKVKKYKVKSEVPAFEINEQELLLKTIKERSLNINYYYAVVIAFDTGMRKNEITTLKWKQIDFENSRIRLLNKITKEPEHAYFSNNTLTIFNELKQTNVISNDGFIWGIKLNDRYISKMFNNCRDRAGLSNKIRFHSTRHTAITRWANTLPFHIAQDLARHSSANQTKNYIDTKKEQLKKAINL